MYDQIVQFLKAQGFIQREDLFVKATRVIAGEMIINGNHQLQYRDVCIGVKYIGEGWEGNSETDNNPLTQWSISDGNYVQQVLVHDLEEFKEYLGGKR